MLRTATLSCYRTLVQKNPALIRHWERTGQAKIALKATSEKQLMELEANAKAKNLCARVVKDGETRTILAIGPAPVELVNAVTGKLRLL
ncbi:Peptidyl-tRNA hydrolase II [Mycena indigotica]|uniref:peptidyl-tRNA hydrolase n=1 Tax=Mycena indigotica TaxID=2126181 RepID=A0A8H6SWI4_9AGAR|nr:Peptidyl-tRNA hydrolase II [Mycena indigotica]KAF7306726.1 Peptidyl-tRNA hydrolase II [Mycena indigotica]